MDSELLQALGPGTRAFRAALDEILSCPARLPTGESLSPKAEAAIRTRCGSADPAAYLHGLRVYYASLVFEIGRRIAPDCDVLSGSGAEKLVLAWPDRAPGRAAMRGNVDSLAAAIPPCGRDSDLFRQLYQAIFPATVRQACGEFYTPQWLVDFVLDRAAPDLHGGTMRLLDPSCGSGAFLVRAARRIAAAGRDPLEDVCGFDTNPLAVLTARVNLLACLARPARAAARMPSVFLHDCILDPPRCGQFGLVVGNPPWVLWDNLPQDWRRRTADLWRDYGLFSLSAREAQLGGGKKDLAMLLTYAAADRCLAPGGRLAFIVDCSLLRSGRAGAGFRRFSIGSGGMPLRVESFDDLTALKPFDAANRAGLIVLVKGEATRFPVPWTTWSRGPDSALRSSQSFARPRDSAEPGSTWVFDDRADHAAPATHSDYTARTGAFSGGANGVFWVDVLAVRHGAARVRNVTEGCKSRIVPHEADLEAELLYPLLRWRDVARWHARPRQHVLLVQDAARRKPMTLAELQARFPLALAWVAFHEEALRARKSGMLRRLMERTEFYAMFGIGDYTLSPWKVIWRRMAKEVTAAVAGYADLGTGMKPVVPQETLTFVPCAGEDEAHYLCALLNSPRATQRLRAVSIPGGKSFGSAGTFAHLGIRRFDPADAAHAELASLSRAAHVAAAEGCPAAAAEERIAGIVEGGPRLFA